MKRTAQQNSVGWLWILLASICLLLFIFLLFGTTIVVSLIPIYLPKKGSDIVMSNDATSTSFRATYITNLLNTNKLYNSESTSLAKALTEQLQLSKSSSVNIMSSQFLSASSNSRKKRISRATCDRDTNGFTGDYYNLEAQVDDSKVCHTQYCGDTFSNKVSTAVQTYSTLNLPFESVNGSLVNIQMVLCKFGVLLSSGNCSDNIQNLDETAIDCGGTICPRRCEINQTCIKTSDCDNATCVAGICLGDSQKILAACQLIQNEISNASQVFYPYSSEYNTSIYHYAISSIEISACSVEPGTADDVRIVLSIIGELQIPFGIKGGGHAMNPGFSSTTGILIVMSRFNQIIYHKNNETVDLGAGQRWHNVYETLSSYNVTVIGGRVNSVGIAGLMLGGGYSWKSSQYGLSIDNILEYELITPNYTIVHVNNVSYPDIFFGLKGGYNNFGIVTKFSVRAVPQTDVYGGTFVYSPLQINAFMQALANFQQNNTDPKAQVIGSIAIGPGQYVGVLVLFYDAPTAPNGTFDEFINITHFGTLTTQSYLSAIGLSVTDPLANLRNRYDTVSFTRLTPSFLLAVTNELLRINSTLGSRPAAVFAFSIQPFLPTYLARSTGGAYAPEASSVPLFPISIQFTWALSSDDTLFIDGIKSSANAVLQAAINDGQNVAGSNQIIYPNYALEDTPLQSMYGNNLARLQSIRKAWDPNNIMYLTGGFKF